VRRRPIESPQAREFRGHGFTIARGFFSKQEVATLREEAERRTAEEDTADVLTDDALIFAHNLFKHSEVYQRFLSQKRIIDFLTPIAGGDLWVRWDQAVTKRPGAGLFRWHQDNGYSGVRSAHLQLWVALTETRNENGALWLVPGSHRRGLLPHARVHGAQLEVQAEVGESICIDAAAGDLILFSSLLLHRTGPNETDTTRVVYVAEYLPCRDYDYDLQPPYFIVSSHGVSQPRFVDRQPGARSVRNQLRYWRPRAEYLVSELKRPLRALRDAVRAEL